MSADVERIVRENDHLTREVRDLRARLAAVESSRWWRLHPRVAVRQLRARLGRTANGAADDQQPEAAAHRFPVDFDEADVELCRRVGPYTMTSPPRLYALARAVEYVAGGSIPGALVECGVWRGGSMMAVALTLLRLGITDRDLYLYDTFAGMTPPTDADVKPTGERAADLLADEARDAEVWAIASLEEVREAVLGVGYPEERIYFVQGPVEETLPASAPNEIALLRLDTDWYASTKHELVHLYPRLAPAGVLLLDDYGFWQGARRAVDEYVAGLDTPLLLNRIDHTGRIALKP
jgi:O-methyltransferase